MFACGRALNRFDDWIFILNLNVVVSLVVALLSIFVEKL